VDNFTHSLAGLVIGDAAIALRQRLGMASSARFRMAALTSSVFANNAPDLDFVYTRITRGPLGYLLHHRGHTHTLLALLPLALFCAWLVPLAFRLRPDAGSPRQRASLGAIGLLGGVVHIGLDFCNNYGVHPFWPVHDGWFYGDAIFIVDPWLIIILSGMAMGAAATRTLKGILGLGLAGLLALAWAGNIVGAGLAAAISAFAIVWVAALWRGSFRRRWSLGGGALIALVTVLLGTRHVARASVRDALAADARAGGAAAERDTAELVGLVSTPSPGNPLCWSVLAVQVSAERYVVRQAMAAGWPWLSSAASCRSMNRGQTARLVPSTLAPVALEPERVRWGGELRAPLKQLEATRQESCVARAFLRFARVPFWLEDGGRATLIGDLRFDRSSAVEFAELLLSRDAPCPRFVPPWQPPLPLPADR
jgi:inner membrane protein